MEVGVSRSYLEATRKNKGKAKIGPDGELVNYAGQGLPFPDVSPDDPQAGVKGAWNYELRHAGDDFNEVGWLYYLTDSKGNIKFMSGDWLRVVFNRRTDIPPTPSLYGDREREVWYKEITSFKKPFSSKGLAQLVIKYVDPKRERDLYVYVPGLRRVTRVGGGNRCDALGGFTFNMDDSNCWSGDTSRFEWKLLVVKDHLVNTLRDWEYVRAGHAYQRKAHHIVPKLERRKVWVIEQTPKFKGYCYSKRMYYLDPQSWWFMYQEMFDRSGKLWKELDQEYSIFPNREETGGGHIIINVAGDCTDFRIWEAGPYHHVDIRLNIKLSPDHFSLDALRRAGR